MTFDIKQHRGLSRQNDEWYCAECGKRWDVKDQDVPDCVALSPTLRRPSKPELQNLRPSQAEYWPTPSAACESTPVRKTVVCHMSTPTGVKAVDTLKRLTALTEITLKTDQAQKLVDEYRKVYPDISNLAAQKSIFRDIPHTLYTDDDEDAPDIIKDRNGDVALGMCRVCGRAEQELVDVPYCTGPRVVGKKPELAAPYATGSTVNSDAAVIDFLGKHPEFRINGGIVKCENDCQFFTGTLNFGNPHGDGMVGDPRPSPAEITKRNIDAMERMGLITSKEAALQRINLIASSREDLTQAIENAPDLMALVNDIFGGMMRRLTVGVHLTEFDDDWLLSIADKLDQYAQEQRPEDDDVLSATHHAARFIRAYVKAIKEGKTE